MKHFDHYEAPVAYVDTKNGERFTPAPEVPSYGDGLRRFWKTSEGRRELVTRTADDFARCVASGRWRLA